MELKGGKLEVFPKEDRVILKVEGKTSADILIPEEGIREGKEVRDEFSLPVEKFMELFFFLYGIEEKVVLNLDNKRIECGVSRDPFIKFTVFPDRRTIFYLGEQDLDRVKLGFESLVRSLPEVKFFHEDVFVRYSDGVLQLATSEESIEVRGFTLTLMREVIRNGFTDVLFLSFGAGGVSIVKPTGHISFRGRVYKDRTRTVNFHLCKGRPVPKLTAKIYLVIR